MAYQAFDLSPAGVARRDQMVHLVRDRVQMSEQASWDTRRMLPRLYQLYRGNSPRSLPLHKNDIRLPYVFAAVRTATAKQSRALFLDEPVTFEGAPVSNGASYARKQQQLFMQQFRDDRGYMKGQNVLLSGALYGRAMAQTGYKYEERQMERAEILRGPLSDKMIKAFSKTNEVVFDGPTFEPFDLLDWFPEKDVVDVADMRHGTRRRWLDFDVVNGLAEQGFFDQSEVDRMRLDSFDMESKDELKVYRSYGNTGGVEMGTPRELYERPVQLLDHYGFLPPELCPDGITFRVITVANNKYLLRNRPFPFQHGKLDWLFPSWAPFYDPHFHFAPGRVEIAERMQLAANKFINKVLDGLDVAVEPWMFIDDAAQIDPRGLNLKAGRIIRTQGPPAERVMAGAFNLNGMQLGISSTQMLSQWIQQAMGLPDDAAQGLMTGRDETARGFLGRAEAASTRIEDETLNAEVQFLEPMADAWMENNRQFMSPDRAVQILGEQSRIDPYTGLEIPPGDGVVTAGDIQPRYRARARGATMRLSRAMQQQNAMLLTQTVWGAAASNPAIQSQLNMVGWLKWLGKLYEVGPEVNELIHTQPQNQLASMAASLVGAGKLPAAGAQPMIAGQPGTSDVQGQPALMGNISGGLQR